MPPLTSYLRNPRPFLTGFAFTAATCIFINDNILEATSITGASMSPTLSPTYETDRAEDRVLWKKWTPTRKLQRGDVVHFANPTKPDSFAVKRVIALEGDQVVLDPRRRPAGKSGIEVSEAKGWDAWQGTATVPPGHVWVEGDNWRSSKDSNWYGPVSRSLINGRAVVVTWPLGRIGAKPWERYQIRTRVAKGVEVRDWTEGLPVELAEVGEGIPP